MPQFIWTPPPRLVADANVTKFSHRAGLPDAQTLLARSFRDQEWFWDAVVRDLGVEFTRPYHTVRDTSAGHPWTDWYLGGELNIAANCLDRHLARGAGDRPALITEREDGTVGRLSYAQLARAVARCAGGLRRHGIERGDRVGAYMPMTTEVVIQLLACCQIGAVFVPIFSGYAPAAAAERLRHAEAKLLFTADGTMRRGTLLPIKPQADAAADLAPTVEHVVVVHALPVPLILGERDVAWETFLASGQETPSVPLGAMEPAMLLYTSGTTGRPKGTVHSHAGALVQIAKETGYAFDLRPADVFFWLTDIGWMMGPWAILGGLFHGATVVLYDGAFDWPDPGRLWHLVARHRVSVLGLSPTAVRLAMRQGRAVVDAHDLSRLRLLGSTGEPWDEDSWIWYFEVIGGGRCPIINISGGTDILGCFLSPLPTHALKPCTLVGPRLGMAVDAWSEAGTPVRRELGYLVATEPAPSMTRGLWHDADRYLASYWSRWDGVWDHGDWVRIDEDGYWFLLGRADDTLKIAGRRIGPAEIEGALIETGKVSEAAAVGVPHDIKGEGIVCFAVLRPGVRPSENLRVALSEAVVQRLGKIDRPERILFVDDLPKTRSAKIMRRVVRDAYLRRADLGDLSSLQNPAAIAAVQAAR